MKGLKARLRESGLRDEQVVRAARLLRKGMLLVTWPCAHQPGSYHYQGTTPKKAKV